MKRIPLTKGKFAIVDDEDFEWLNQWKWHYLEVGYAARSKWLKGKNKSKLVYMHRIILNPTIDYETDHINENKLDNRKINLRAVKKSYNTQNITLRKDNTTGYKGVIFMGGKGRIKRWVSSIYYHGKRICLGVYMTKEEAALAYNQGALKYFGEFARLNVI